jgi:hypothetical protein
MGSNPTAVTDMGSNPTAVTLFYSIQYSPKNHTFYRHLLFVWWIKQFRIRRLHIRLLPDQLAFLSSIDVLTFFLILEHDEVESNFLFLKVMRSFDWRWFVDRYLLADNININNIMTGPQVIALTKKFCERMMHHYINREMWIAMEFRFFPKFPVELIAWKTT